jgi:hypothetical protein
MRALARWISPEPLAAKVPQIGVLFWVVKLLTTAGGEAVSCSRPSLALVPSNGR